MKQKLYRIQSIDWVRLRDCLPVLSPPRVYWAEPGQPPLLSSGASEVLCADMDNRFDSIKHRAKLINLKPLEENPDSFPQSAKPRFFGGFSFLPDSAQSSRWDTFQCGRFMLPEIQLTETAGKVWLTVIGESSREITEKIQRFKSCFPRGQNRDSTIARHTESLTQKPTREQWLKNTRGILETIENGTLDKLVVARAMDIQTDRALSAEYLHERLIEAHTNTYRFLFNPREDEVFLGATPENLIEQNGSVIHTESLAGTIEAGKTESESRNLAKNLASSQKDQAEHRLVIESLKQCLEDQVSRLDFGDQTVRRFPTVQHLYTPIEGKLKTDLHILDLVGILHPTPAVGGHPSPDFRSYLSKYEPFERGWYASPVGWFDRDGNGRFAVAIRSALANKRDVRLFAGAGIVSDSIPEKEWDEVQWKFQSLLNILLP